MLIDTNVIIDWLRGREQAANFLRTLGGKPFVSAITVAELYRGVREVHERQRLVEALNFYTIVSVDEVVAERGGHWARQFGPSHAVDLLDALIAACAELVDARLVTCNRKHFPMLPDLLVPY